jgi:hypothetical protein
MTTVVDALNTLNIEYVIYGNEPTDETSFYANFYKVMGTKEDGSAELSNDPTDHNVTWRWVSQKKQQLIDAEPMRLLREERNRLIALTDWWASSDLTMTQAQRDYRQALRDITTTQTPALDADGNLTGVTWPTKP